MLFTYDLRFLQTARKLNVLITSTMMLGLLLLFELSQFTSCELVKYISEESYGTVTHTEKISAKTVMMCANICIRRGCTTIGYEGGEFK